MQRIVIARTIVQGIESGLKIEDGVGIARQQRNGNAGKPVAEGPLKNFGPGALAGPTNKRTVIGGWLERPIGRQALASQEQIDFDKVSAGPQKFAAFFQV